jgi:hypothetical protein
MDQDKSSVTYNRTKRKWIYTSVNGETTEFDAGKTGKLSAQEYAIEVELPDIHLMLERLYEAKHRGSVMKRATQGATILRQGLLLEPAFADPPTVVARAATSTRTVEYLICVPNDTFSTYSCSCPDWLNGRLKSELPEEDPQRPQYAADYIDNVGILCKHAWALHFQRMTDLPMAKVNPFQKDLAKQLLQTIKDAAVKQQPEIVGYLNETTPVSFGLGILNLHTSRPDTNTHLHNESNTRFLTNVTHEATAGTAQIYISN